MIFDIENWLWKLDLVPFWQLVWKSVNVKSSKYFSKIYLFLKQYCARCSFEQMNTEEINGDQRIFILKTIVALVLILWLK